MKTRIWVIAGVLAIVSSTAWGQITGTSAGFGSNGQFSTTASFSAPRYSMPVVAGAPYSAEQVAERTQTLNDGTRITDEPRSQFRMYRDSAGRTRTERPFIMGHWAEPNVPIIIEINDPVAGCQYILDTVNQVAHRSVYQTPPQASAAPSIGGMAGGIVSAGETTLPAPSARVLSGPGPSVAANTRGPLSAAGVRPEFSTESLGTRVIEGVLAEGKRSTTTYAAGSVGNDRPFATTSEVWTSPELKIMILSRHSDPRSGENVTRLINLSRTEPDPGLFKVPVGYQIIEETGPFTVKITRP